MPTRSTQIVDPWEVPEDETQLAPLADENRSLAISNKASSPEEKKVVSVEMATQQNFIKCHGNEDSYLKGFISHDAFCFGVMDGHDGAYAAKAVAISFVPLLETALQNGSHILKAIDDSIESIEKTLCEDRTTAGSCCLICIYREKYLWCANLGDCRGCFLSLTRSGIAGITNEYFACEAFMWLSRDMKAGMWYETARIEKAGGVIIDGRIEGLEPSRTVGDFDVKDQVPPEVISIKPETRGLDISEMGAGIAMLCTDGVWDVLVAADMSRIVWLRLPLLRSNVSQPQEFLRAVAADIVAYSVAKGSPDDCTAVCALLGGQDLLTAD